MIGGHYVNPYPSPPQSNEWESGLNLTKQGVVLLMSATSTDPDSAYIESPSVIFDGTKYCMYYTGYESIASVLVGSICLATADTPEGPWTKEGLVLGGSGSGGDATGCTGPAPYYESGTYYLYYIGLNGSGYEAGNTGIYLATATARGGTFTRQGVKIEASGSGWRQNTVWKANMWKKGASDYVQFFNAGDGAIETIGFATGTTPSGPWTVDDVNSPVLSPGAGGAWDNAIIGDPDIYKVGTTMYMAYYAAGSGSIRNGVATCAEANFPIGAWTKYAGNPTLNTGAQYTYDDVQAAKPSIVIYNNKHYHFYASKGHVSGVDGVPAIGLATEAQ